MAQDLAYRAWAAKNCQMTWVAFSAVEGGPVRDGVGPLAAGAGDGDEFDGAARGAAGDRGGHHPGRLDQRGGAVVDGAPGGVEGGDSGSVDVRGPVTFARSEERRVGK